ncbi:hypothetical protein BDV12DRAFT_188882 [Aspergillus spectabilis]
MLPAVNGCLRCISRRTKCDETRPECLRCVSQGPKCPGYDCAFAPNLAGEAIGIQTKELFERWLDYYFPTYITSFQSRVDVNWIDFIRSQWSTFPQALIWAIRALTSLRMGAAQGNKEAILCARHMYSRGIKHLAYLLQTKAAALSNETLAAAILLGGYEHLLCTRGPSAHKSGMGRTLVLCWRPYIVADAFIHGMPCFLGDLEWTHLSLSRQVATVEDQQQKESLLGQALDYAFNDVAKCPGYLATTKNIVNSDTNVARAISRENLVRFHSMVEEFYPAATLTGAIPPIYATTIVQGSRNGISSAIALLDQLTTILQTHSRGRPLAVLTASYYKLEEDPWRLAAESQAVKFNRNQSSTSRQSEDPDLRAYVSGNQLDQFSLTTGMGSLLPDTCSCPQFSVHKTIPSRSTSI